MIWNLLAEGTPQGTNNYGSLIMIAVMSALLIVFMIINIRSQKKRQEETQSMLDAIQPGNKVKTIGGICCTVVEVCKEDNTFVLETGSEKSGKSYLRFDKQAVYQSDVTVDKNEKKEEVETANEENKND
jgi:preprotein translocase YajC subunit